jgi:hypothetical protein
VNVTEQMKALSRQISYRRLDERPKTPRDRSLRGKDRIRARKASNAATRNPATT